MAKPNDLCRDVEINVELMAGFDEVYEKYEYLNAGTFGKVYKCRKKLEGDDTRDYAVKIQDVCFADDEDRSSYEKTLNEANIWSSLKHDNIVVLYQCFLQAKQFYFVMELIQGGNLFEEILKKSSYTEKDACSYTKQLLNALSYLHVKGIIHRDVKPDNVMLCENTTYGYGTTSLIKLTDFGLARRMKTNDQQYRLECSLSGASLYLAPETIMQVRLGFPVDVWACGIILYIMLYGTPPFWSQDTDQLFLNIVGTEVDYSCNAEEITVSFLGKDLIQEMLVKDQNLRITACDALQHPWIVQGDKLSREHRRSTLEKLSLFSKNSYDAAMTQRLGNKSQRNYNK